MENEELTIPAVPADETKLIRRYKWSVRFSKIKRLLAAVPIADFLATIVALAAVVTIGASIVAGAVNPGTLHYLWISEIIAFLLSPALVVLLACKTWLEYQRRKYDPSLIWTFQKEFDALAEQRKEAAVVCFDFIRWNAEEEDEIKRWAAMDTSERVKVEPVLDCFEDLREHLLSNEVSPASSKGKITGLAPHGGRHTREMAFRERVDFAAYTKGADSLGRGYVMLTSGRKVFFDFPLLPNSMWERALAGFPHQNSSHQPHPE